MVRGEDWLLHGTSRAEAAKAYISDAVEATHQSKSSTDCLPRWAKVPAGGKFEKISGPSGCAQVEPRELCEWLIEQCQNRGVEISLNTRPIGLLRDRRGQFSAVQVETDRKAVLHRHTISCQDIVISAGCWTPRVFKALLNQQMSPSVKPLPGYSRVVRSSRFSRSILEPARDGHNTQIAHATFCPPTSKWSYSPECMARYTRSGKPEIYVAGLNDESIRLPERAGDLKHVMDRSKLDDLKTTARDLVGVDDDTELELVREGLCCRPVSDSGLPIISQVGGIKTSKGGRMYVASGHGPWGVSLSLGTGFVISELLQNKKHEALTQEMELNKQPEMLRARL